MADDVTLSVQSARHEGDHDLLVRLDTKFDIFIQTQGDHGKTLKDHDTRLGGHDQEIAELKARPHFSLKVIWTGIVSLLGAGGGIVAVINAIMQHKP